MAGTQQQLWHGVAVNWDQAAGEDFCEAELGASSAETQKWCLCLVPHPGSCLSHGVGTPVPSLAPLCSCPAAPAAGLSLGQVSSADGDFIKHRCFADCQTDCIRQRIHQPTAQAEEWCFTEHSSFQRHLSVHVLKNRTLAAKLARIYPVWKKWLLFSQHVWLRILCCRWCCHKTCGYSFALHYLFLIFFFPERHLQQVGVNDLNSRSPPKSPAFHIRTKLGTSSRVAFTVFSAVSWWKICGLLAWRRQWWTHSSYNGLIASPLQKLGDFHQSCMITR